MPRSPPMRPTLRIMLVDDSESRSLELSLMLAKLGYDVMAEVFNPRELYGKVSELAPDVIIIDTDSPTRDRRAAPHGDGAQHHDRGSRQAPAGSLRSPGMNADLFGCRGSGLCTAIEQRRPDLLYSRRDKEPQ